MRGRAALAAIPAILAGCVLLPSPAPNPYDIHVSNGTTLEVGVFVNGALAATIAPGTRGTVAPRGLPPLPWQVELRTGTGRVLLDLAVAAGDVDVEGNAQQGVGDRIDLSCGRLDAYVGPPMLGPAPGPGVPGDCEP